MINEQMVTELLAQGLDKDFLMDMVARHGQEVLDLLQKALLLGFNNEVIKDLITLAGKVGFELLVKVLDLKMVLRGSGDVVGPDYNKAVMEVLAKYKSDNA